MATTTSETHVGPAPSASGSGLLPKLLLGALFLLQLFLHFVVNQDDYWWRNGFWTFITIALAIAFFVTWWRARRNVPGSVWGLGWFAVILIFGIMIWL